MIYDIAVIGGGPAGLSAAVQARQRNRTAVVVSGDDRDGPLSKTERVDNYLGIHGATGPELLERFKAHAQTMGVERVTGRALNIMPLNGTFYIGVGSELVQARAVVLAPGVVRRAKFPGEAEHMGAGVSYCATCDGNFFRGRDTAVVGGGNTALEDALFLANICPNVYLVHRRDTFKAERHLIDALAAAPNIHVLLSHKVVEVQGEQAVTSLLVEGPDGRRSLPVAGVFAAVGLAPDNQVFSPPLELNEAGYIIAGEDTRTNVPGIFAAGDTRVKDLRQLVTAAADGASAASQAGRYLQSAQ